jgi:hypothetical protein
VRNDSVASLDCNRWMMSDIVLFSQVLAYVNYNSDRAVSEKLRKVVLGLYSVDEISEAKKKRCCGQTVYLVRNGASLCICTFCS